MKLTGKYTAVVGDRVAHADLCNSLAALLSQIRSYRQSLATADVHVVDATRNVKGAVVCSKSANPADRDGFHEHVEHFFTTHTVKNLGPAFRLDERVRLDALTHFQHEKRKLADARAKHERRYSRSGMSLPAADANAYDKRTAEIEMQLKALEAE